MPGEEAQREGQERQEGDDVEIEHDPAPHEQEHEGEGEERYAKEDAVALIKQEAQARGREAGQHDEGVRVHPLGALHKNSGPDTRNGSSLLNKLPLLVVYCNFDAKPL